MKTIYKHPLYYEGELTYVQVPRLIFNPPFEDMTDEAKILYGLILDQMEQSYDDPARWMDNGEAYVYFQITEAMRILHIGRDKAIKLFKELEEANLIRRKRQRAERKPSKIYVNTYWETAQNIPVDMDINENTAFKGPKRRMKDYVNVYWVLFDAPYDQLSNGARILYGLLQKQMNWDKAKGALRHDKTSAYIYYQVDKVMQKLNIAEGKAVKIFHELEAANLIQRERQGFGRPAKIRLQMPVETPTAENRSTKSENRKSPKSENRKSPKSENRKSPKSENRKSTYIDIQSSTYSINLSTKATTETPSDPTGRLTEEEAKKQVAAQIDKQALYGQYPQNRATIDNLTNIMEDELSSDRPTATVGGATRTRAEIRVRLSSVETSDVAAILDSLKKSPPKMSNPRGYLLTCLYNAPAIRIADTATKHESELWKYAEQLKRRREKKKNAGYYAQELKKEEEENERKILS